LTREPSSKESRALERHETWAARMAGPRLPMVLVGIALLLATPTLWLGFYQDDFVGRYIYDDALEGAKDLFRAYTGGYGISNGVVADNHWQAEAGHAPWWIYPQLKLALFRPIGQFTHILDVRLWPSSAALWHVHTFVWLSLLVVAMTKMYRSVLGASIGGVAALLFAIDHTHGFAVGYITNRHTIISALFGALTLIAHFRLRKTGKWGWVIPAQVLYVLGLLTSESSISVAAYVFAYAIAADEGSLGKRVLSVVPYFVTTVAWRAVYVGLGNGVQGSGVYIDPGHEPLQFLLALLERAPVLLTGQFFVPPSEVMYLLPDELSRWAVLFAVLFCLALAASFVPLLQGNRLARFWALGMLGSLVPAASTFPHNRQLMFTSFGAMALLAQLWELQGEALKGAATKAGIRLLRAAGSLSLGFHAFLSPFVFPLAACSVVLARPYHIAIDRVGDEIQGKDLVFIAAPDYLAVRLVQLMRRVDHRPLPRRIRALSFGGQPGVLHRTGERTLGFEYTGGIMQTTLSELYRDRKLPFTLGEQVHLEGMTVTVTGLTEDGRVNHADFEFDTTLDSPTFVFYNWGKSGFEPFHLPRVGETVQIAAPAIPF
jgi:hypothetical protein